MRKISWLALALWAVTIAAAGFVFIKGYTAPGDDGRTVIQLTKDEQTFVLSEMRGLLEAVRDITMALDDNDMNAVADAVKDKGVDAMMRNTPMTIMAKIPADFRGLGQEMHQGFDDIGAAAKAGDKAKVLSLLSEQLSRCVACHGSFRLSGSP